MPGAGGAPVVEPQDHVALSEIELCGELMIAAAAVREERLSQALIDELLDVRPREPVARLPAQGRRPLTSA
jgi:hypothetical protein